MLKGNVELIKNPNYINLVNKQENCIGINQNI
jgi:hypothetical protein